MPVIFYPIIIVIGFNELFSTANFAFSIESLINFAFKPLFYFLYKSDMKVIIFFVPELARTIIDNCSAYFPYNFCLKYASYVILSFSSFL